MRYASALVALLIGCSTEKKPVIDAFLDVRIYRGGLCATPPAGRPCVAGDTCRTGGTLSCGNNTNVDCTCMVDQWLCQQSIACLCPPQQPTADVLCGSVDLRCQYHLTCCTCQLRGDAGAGTFDCHASNSCIVDARVDRPDASE